MAQPNRAANKPPSRYVSSSSFTKTILYDRGEGVPSDREQVHMEEGITEEISFSFTVEKTQDLIEKIKAALDDPQGDGGLRFTLYCNSKTNKEKGEKFDSLALAVVGKFPSKNNFKKNSSFSGGGSNRGGGNGRRDYPSQQGNGSGQTHGQQATANNPHAGPSAAPAKSATPDRGETIQKAVNSPDKGYSQEPGW